MEEQVLFGNGKICKRILENSNRNIVAIIDNDKNKWGSIVCQSGKEIPVICMDEYLEKYADIPVLISVSCAKDIEEQLKTHGVLNFSVATEVYEPYEGGGEVSIDTDIIHDNWLNYITGLFDKEGNEILEIGSRVVTGTNNRDAFKKATYTGFDIYEGENVDVVGDVHKLSQYFNKKFDLIFSSAVFEHLAMPWIASKEIIKCLKVGGCVFIETHYSFSSHERPWHFFQFSENALNNLFPSAFGMRCLKKSCSNLIEGRFSSKSSLYLQGKTVSGLYCHSEYLGQKIEEKDSESMKWEKLSVSDVVNGTEYPKPYNQS